jgi:undecaprenyl-diphosphatase
VTVPAGGPGPTRTDSRDRSRSRDRAARRWAVALLAAFLLLAVLVVLRWPPLVDRDLSTDLAVHAMVLRDRALLTTATIVTNAGSPVSVDIITALVAGWLLYRRRIGPAVYLVAARLVELVVETIAKHVVGRPRPALPDPIGHASSFSFPSGHTSGTAVLCAALVVLALQTSRRHAAAWVVLAGVAIVAVAASRVLLGVHYPSDVLGGALLGVACALITRPLLSVAPKRGVAAPDREPPRQR